MKRILIITTSICSLFLLYSSKFSADGKHYVRLTGTNFIRMEKVKRIATNIIIYNGYLKNFIPEAKNENLINTTWGSVILVKKEMGGNPKHIYYYYMVHGIYFDQGIIAYSCINAVTGKQYDSYIHREYGNRYLLTGQEAADYALDQLKLPGRIHYTISAVHFDLSNLDAWKYRIVFDQYITTRKGVTNTIFVDPYITALEKEPPTHLNGIDPYEYPHRLFILKQSDRDPFLRKYIGIDGAENKSEKLYIEPAPDLKDIDIISIEQVKQIIPNDKIASGTIVLVKLETRTIKFKNLDYYYVAYGILPGQGIFGYSCINAVTGRLFKNDFIRRRYGNWYLLTSREAADYALDKLHLPTQIHYTISPVMNFCFPEDTYYINWKYKIVFNQYITTREGKTNTIYVDPYIVASKREPPNHLNTPHSSYNPYRLFILTQSPGNPAFKDYIGIDGLQGEP